MGEALTILAIGGDAQTLTTIGTCIERRGLIPRLAQTAEEGLRVHRDEGAELVILALPLRDAAGAQVMRQLRAQDPRVSLVVTGKDDQIQGAPDALRWGAVEYLSEPVRDQNELLSVIGVALGERKSDAQLRFLRQKDALGAEWQTMVGQCPAMAKVSTMVRQVCQRTAVGGSPIILITGETGTGKGMLAKSVHYNSARRSRAFVDLNCAAIPATLIESELLGHERGAFTDARAARPGLFETADGGTLFLDEIGAMPLELQAKALIAIEEKRVRRLGAQHAKQVDVQVIAATHRNLFDLVARGEFRADLYHRLNVLAIELPPLRARGEDRVLLAREFLRTMCKQYGLPERHLDESACAAIERYPWPGNVRELRNQLERILMLENDDVIRAEHFLFGATRPSPVERTVVVKNEGELIVELPDGGVPLEALERAVLNAALERCRGNVSHAARYLSISRQTMIYRMKKYQLGGGDLPDDGSV